MERDIGGGFKFGQVPAHCICCLSRQRDDMILGQENPQTPVAEPKICRLPGFKGCYHRQIYTGRFVF